MAVLKKISYRSKENPPRKPIGRDTEVFNIGSEDPVSRSDGAAGIIPIDIRDVQVDDDSDIGLATEYEPSGPIEPDVMDKLNDLFVVTADALDRSGQHDSANFMDFLIKKYAESKEVDYSRKLNELLFKIRDSSAPDVNSLMTTVINIYSSRINSEVKKGSDIFNSKEAAYNESLLYLNNFFKGRL